MKRSKNDVARKKLELRRERLRQLDSPALERVAGGKVAAPDGAVLVLPDFLRRCMGTGYAP